MSSLRPPGWASVVTQWPQGRLCVVKFTAVGVGFAAFGGLLRDRALPSLLRGRAVDMFFVMSWGLYWSSRPRAFVNKFFGDLSA